MGCGLGGTTGTADYASGSRLAAGQVETGRKYGEQYTQQAADYLNPYSSIGTKAADIYSGILGGDMSNFYTSPGYEWRLGEGVKALERGAAAQGGLLSGAQQKALTEYGQNYGSNEYGNYMGNLTNALNLGLGAASTQGGYYSNLSSSLLGAYSGLGQTQAQMAAGAGNLKAEMLGGMMGAGGSMGAAALMASDKNVKENIEYTGEKTSDNIPIVTFNYKKEFEKLGLDSNKKYKGVIAQDVEKVKPEAVVEEDGIKKVIYSMIGMKMEEV